jgi:hypothetical protein
VSSSPTRIPQRFDSQLVHRCTPAAAAAQGVQLLASAAVAHPLMDLAARVDSKRMLIILSCLILPVLGMFTREWCQ